jgi:hypothetical protein
MLRQVRVNPTDDFNAAVRAAAPGTQLILAPGRHSGNIEIDKPLEITGPWPFGTVELSAEKDSCLTVTSPQTVISGLHLEAASDSVTLLDIQADDVAVNECVLAGGATTVRVGGTNIAVNRCEIRNGTTGLHLDQCEQVDIVDCGVHDHRSTGVLCTNLSEDTRLIGCELASNGEFGLATSYFRQALEVYGPTLHRCLIHHNGMHGVHIVDEAWHTSLTNCRIFDNVRAQVSLSADVGLHKCDIAGGQIGVAVTGGEARITGIIGTCTVHDMPVGIWISAPLEKGEKTFIHSSWIYNTTEAAARTTDQGALDFLHCIVRDNTGIGIDVGSGTTQQVSECRVARNGIGVLIRPEGLGEVKESVVSQNNTGIYAQPGSKVEAWYCHVENHTGPAVVLEAGSTGHVYHCMYRGNRSGDIKSDAESNVRVYGDPLEDPLVKRNVEIPPE